MCVCVCVCVVRGSLYQNNEILSKNPVICSGPQPPDNSLGLNQVMIYIYIYYILYIYYIYMIK